MEAARAEELSSTPGDSVAFIDGLGDHHYAISSTVDEAQRYFDQGFRLYYAFNHPEAIRSFRHATSLDPECAICWWGVALAHGPNINAPMDSASAVEAYAAIQEAERQVNHASAEERALIEALAGRYAANPPAERAALDSAYASAMAAVVRQFPESQEAAVLYGESLMDLRPWNYWTDEGEPYPGTQEALAAFEGVLAVNPRHPGACHFFIHAVEAEHPERAVPCAERLAGLMPGAGHIVHMPGHIYIRVGRYLDAIEANEHAVHADESYIQDRRPGTNFYTAGYYPHNYDFMAFAAAMAARPDQSIDAADRLAELIPPEMLGSPELPFLQHWSTRPLQMRIRFGRWDEILRQEQPAEGLPHARAMWHFARGTAHAATGDPSAAEVELERLREEAADPSLDGMSLEFNAARDILGIAEHVLAGRIAAARKDHAGAEAHLREAVRREDALVYGEPPEWSIPTRHDLGTVLLATGRPAEAERVFREDLERFPKNAWSLLGLRESLEARGAAQEAASVTAQLEEALRGSDFVPESPRY
jgi:tetratricopeptide (TPR) repeat protein